jgi:hypothetical protein
MIDVRKNDEAPAAFFGDEAAAEAPASRSPTNNRLR